MSERIKVTDEHKQIAEYIDLGHYPDRIRTEIAEALAKRDQVMVERVVNLFKASNPDETLTVGYVIKSIRQLGEHDDTEQ